MTSDQAKGYSTNPELMWLYPQEHKPPLNCKIAILTIGGIQMTGVWNDADCIAWRHLFKRDHEKERSLGIK